MDEIDMARLMYHAYAKEAGGVAFDGKPLPSWDELGENRQDCWCAAALAAEDYMSQFFE